MIPAPLIRDIANGQCLPFIGAGFSLNADLPKNKKMPTFNDIANDLKTELDTKTKDPIEVASE